MNNYNYLQKQASIILNLFNSKNYDEVITRCKTLIKKYPEQVMFYNVAALSYASLKNNLEGLNILNQALKMHRDNLLILNNIGLLNSNLNNNKVARQYYDKALSINENFIDALVNKAHLELKENKTNETERLFLKAHGVNKTIQQQEVIETGLAQLYQQIGNFKKSIKIFQDILKYNPSNTLAHKSISVMHTYKDKNDEHLKKMEEQSKLIKNEELLPPLYFAIGKAYEDLNDFQKSFHFIKSANDILNKKINYTINDDISLFENIKEIFKNINLKENFGASDNFIFIVGMPRSGTTLVEQIISSHSHVYGAGELSFLENSIKKNLIKDNNFISSSINSFNLENLNNVKNDYLDGIKTFDYKEKIITDKAPLNFRWIGFIKILFPNSKIIHCEREPMDVCFSNYKNSFGSNALSYCYNLENLGSYYNLYKNLMIFWHNIFPDGIYNLSYENLTQNQELETKKLIKFCDLNWEKDCLSPHKNKNKISTASLAQARKPIYRTSINKWKNYSKYLENLNKIISL